METSPAPVLPLTELHPMVQGGLATLLAGAALCAWIAVGSFFVRPSTDSDRDVVVLPGSLLVGSGLTAAAYAVFTWLGVVDGAIWGIGSASLIALLLRRRVTWKLVSGLASEYTLLLRESRLLRALAIPVVALLWIYGIAPPRDADVMRYHLAHVRQIITDGRWQAIPDYHYAFPFGWTLNYLPFERLHLPEAASMVNVGLWLAMLGGLLKVTRVSAASRNAALLCIAFLVHPFVLRTFASAMADGYAVFVVYAIALTLLTVETGGDSEASLLGFAAWIGAQSRYQLILAALSATAIFIWMAVRRRSGRGVLLFARGVMAAIFLSSPFYLVNLAGLGNPVWPLFVPAINGTAAYADRVASLYSASLTGSYDPSAVLRYLAAMLTTPALVPLAVLLVVIILGSLLTRDLHYRRVAMFGVFFLFLWGMAQPRFFPKQMLLLLSLGPLLGAQLMSERLSGRVAQRVVRGALVGLILALVTLSAAFSWDYARYALTGNRAEFHRFTWYYPVYEWVNRNTPQDARFLVIAYSGHSYYLDRPYRRADPWLSGVIDWSRVSSPEDLDLALRQGRYEYVIYDDRDWTDFYGGANMSSSVKASVARGSLAPVHVSREKLYSSRVQREFSETTVYVLRRVAQAR